MQEIYERTPPPAWRPRLIPVAPGIDKAKAEQGVLQPLYCTSQVSIFQASSPPPPKSIGTCSVPRLPGLWKMSATATAHSCKGTRDDQLWPLICERRGRPIRGSIARTSRKSRAFMAWLLSFCLRLWQLLISSTPLQSPHTPHACTPQALAVHLIDCILLMEN